MKNSSTIHVVNDINRCKKSFLCCPGAAKPWFVLMLTLAILLGSCKKFLETKPTDFIQPNAFYQSKPQFISALAAIYSPISNYNMYGFFNSVEAQGTANDEGNAFNQSWLLNSVAWNTFDYTHPKLNTFWQNTYAAIEKANLLIANQGNAVNVDPVTLNEIVGEAKFLRGWYYFLLVQYFGAVPLKLTPTTDVNNVNIPRTPIKEVYAQIVKDMTEAEAVLYLPNNPELANSSSRISKTTAEGILARVCLFMAGYPLKDQSQYANALMWAKKVQVTGAGILRLTVNADTMANVANLRGTTLAYPATNGNPAYKNNGFAQVFVNEAKGVYNIKETMWESDAYMQTTTVTVGGYIGGQLGINCNNDFVLGRCAATINAQQYLWNLYGAGDLRRDWAIAPYSFTNAVPAVRNFFNGTAGPALQVLNRACGKWRREYEPMEPAGDKSGWYTTIKFPLLRYSDVLLMLAEAEFNVNGPTQTALDAINQVRRRGYGLDINTPAPAVDLTAATLSLSVIQDERARELCFEALRKSDLIRWGIYLQRVQDVINYNNVNGFPTGNRTNAVASCVNTLAGGTKFLLWPIPSSEMLVNKAITQNPGW